jgi:hypothetical protein
MYVHMSDPKILNSQYNNIFTYICNYMYSHLLVYNVTHDKCIMTYLKGNTYKYAKLFLVVFFF